MWYFDVSIYFEMITTMKLFDIYISSCSHYFVQNMAILKFILLENSVLLTIVIILHIRTP